MNYNNPIPHNVANAIKFSCIALFAVFCFVYLFCLQGDVLAEAQYVFSKGVTTYSDFWGAIIITAILLVVQYLTAKFSRLVGRLYAFTFFPSFLLLAVLTSLNLDTIEDFTFGSWYWVFPILLVLFVLFVKFSRHAPDGSVLDGDYSMSRYLWPNYLVMLVMMILCGTNAPAKDVYMYELKAEKLIRENDYEGAANVGKESLVTSKRLNELRMFALAKQGLLGENLFDYPQIYGDTSLLDFSDTIEQINRFNSKNIQAALGAYAGSEIKSVEHYLDLVHKNQATRNNELIPDYYLCDKLLNKDLKGFWHLLKRYYHLESPIDVMVLPKSYREAMLLQAKAIGRDSLNNFADTLMLSEYKSYKELYDSDIDSTAKANLIHRQYGNTLWRYLDYQEYAK